MCRRNRIDNQGLKAGDDLLGRARRANGTSIGLIRNRCGGEVVEERVIIGEEIRGANEQWGDGSLGNGIEEGQYLEAESRPDESRVVVHGIVEYRNSCCGAERVRL